MRGSRKTPCNDLANKKHLLMTLAPGVRWWSTVRKQGIQTPEKLLINRAKKSNISRKQIDFIPNNNRVQLNQILDLKSVISIFVAATAGQRDDDDDNNNNDNLGVRKFNWKVAIWKEFELGWRRRRRRRRWRYRSCRMMLLISRKLRNCAERSGGGIFCLIKEICRADGE